MSRWKRALDDVGDTADLIRSAIPAEAGERLVTAAEELADAFQRIAAVFVVCTIFCTAAYVVHVIFEDS